MADGVQDLLRALAMMNKTPSLVKNNYKNAPSSGQAQMAANMAPNTAPSSAVQAMFGNNPVGQAQMAKNMAPPVGGTGNSGGGTTPPPADDPWTPYAGKSGDQMAKEQYAAQYALLEKMRGQTTTDYTNAGNQMGNVYEALSKQMSGQTQGIRNDYAAAGKSIGGQYNSAIAASNADYSNSRGAMSQMAKNLGVEQSIPGASQDGYDQQNWLNGLMRANQANDVNTNTRMGQNEVDFNTRNAQIEKDMGADSRSDFKTRMLRALSGIDDKKLTVTANQAESANKYNLDIAGLNAKSKSDYNTNRTTQENNRARSEMDRARLELASDSAKAKASAAANDTSKMNAYDILANDANTAYNGNSQDSQKAIKIIQDLWDGGWGGNKSWTSSGDFASDVARSNPAAASSQLSKLANMFYAKMVKGGAGAATGVGSIGRMDWNG